MAWDDFDIFDDIITECGCWVDRGEGEDKGTQIAIATTKLVYKWFNDGDVFDNTYRLEGWANDLSNYANWLYYNTTDEAARILRGIADCYGDDDYEELLYDLCDELIDRNYLRKMKEEPKVGTIYKCDGPFEFNEDYDDEEEEDY